MDTKLDKNFDEERRKSLIKMGKRAVYVTPVVLTLLTSQKATAMSVAACSTAAAGQSGCSQGAAGSGGNPGQGGSTGQGGGLLGGGTNPSGGSTGNYP